MCLILLTFISGATIWVNPDYIKTIDPLKGDKALVTIPDAEPFTVVESAKCVMYKARYCDDLNPYISPSDACPKKEIKQ